MVQYSNQKFASPLGLRVHIYMHNCSEELYTLQPMLLHTLIAIMIHSQSSFRNSPTQTIWSNINYSRFFYITAIILFIHIHKIIFNINLLRFSINKNNVNLIILIHQETRKVWLEKTQEIACKNCTGNFVKERLEYKKILISILIYFLSHCCWMPQ